MMFWKKRNPKITFKYRSQTELENNRVLTAKEALSQLKCPHPEKKGAHSFSNCPAYFESRRQGFIVRSPIRMDIKVTSDFGIEVRGELGCENFLECHPPEQHRPMWNDFLMIKIQSNVGMFCDQIMPYTYCGAVYHNMKLSQAGRVVPTAISEMSSNNLMHTFIALEVPKSGESIFYIKRDDPLLQIIPHCIDYDVDHVVDPTYVTNNGMTVDDKGCISARFGTGRVTK